MPTPKIMITIRVPPATYNLLDEAARVSKRSMNQVAEDAIERYSKKIIASEKKSLAEIVNDYAANSENPPDA